MKYPLLEILFESRRAGEGTSALDIKNERTAMHGLSFATPTNYHPSCRVVQVRREGRTCGLVPDPDAGKGHASHVCAKRYVRGHHGYEHGSDNSPQIRIQLSDQVCCDDCAHQVGLDG